MCHDRVGELSEDDPGAGEERRGADERIEGVGPDGEGFGVDIRWGFGGCADPWARTTLDAHAHPFRPLYCSTRFVPLWTWTGICRA